MSSCQPIWKLTSFLIIMISQMTGFFPIAGGKQHSQPHSTHVGEQVEMPSGKGVVLGF